MRAMPPHDHLEITERGRNEFRGPERRLRQQSRWQKTGASHTELVASAELNPQLLLGIVAAISIPPLHPN